MGSITQQVELERSKKVSLFICNDVLPLWNGTRGLYAGLSQVFMEKANKHSQIAPDFYEETRRGRR
jgi:hypothetical protein